MATLLIGVEQHQRLYTADEDAHFERSKLIQKFIQRRKAASVKTAVNYRSRIRNFAQFVYRQHDKIELDDFVKDIQDSKHDVYEVLADFAAWLVSERQGESEIRARSVKVITITVKKFLRVSGCAIDTETFKDRVTFGRIERQDYQALNRADVADILNACKDMRLKTALMLFAGLGPRALEGCAVRMQDINLDVSPPTITIQAKYSKMRQARTRPITAELANQIRMWIKVKYAPHGSAVRQSDGSMKHIHVKPEQKLDDLLLAKFRLNGKQPDPLNLYYVVRKEFVELLPLINITKIEGRRHAITLNSFRRYAKTTISDVAGYDYSEYYIGHAGSTYWRKKPEERVATFAKCEPFLTFLDAHKIEAYTADIHAQLDAKDEQHKREMADMEARFRREFEAFKEQMLAYQRGEIIMGQPVEAKATIKMREKPSL